MPGRPVFHKEIGRFFTDLREVKGWTQRQAEDIAERRHLHALTRQVLWRLEKGKTKNIEPVVLRAIAQLYDMPYETLVAKWVAHRYEVQFGKPSDLGRHTREEGSAPQHSGGADVPASARIHELERQVTEYQAAIDQMSDVALRLVEIAEPFARREGLASRARTPRRRGHRRKTG